MSGEYVLKLEGINKYFGPTHANKNISFTLKKGEVRGLAGENGSGKSTLASIIAGINKRDSGIMYKDGKEYDPSSPQDAARNKIGIVVQELGLVNRLPAYINVYLGRTKEFTKYGLVDLKGINDAVNEQLKKWNLGTIRLKSLAEELSVESRKVVELARALSIDPDILILDEVSQALTHDKRVILHEIVHKFKEMGRSVIIISHDVEELLELTDTITVLRDGEMVGTKDTKDLTSEMVKSLMIGRDIEKDYYRSDKESVYENEVVLEIKDLSVENELFDISFEIHKGEIFGICGLSDSGIHILGKAICGIQKINNGSVTLMPEGISVKNSVSALKNGIGYVPKDRDSEALMLSTSIMDNICLPSVTEIQGVLGFLSPKKMKDMASNARNDFEIKSTGIMQTLNHLSGGNKQKVNLGRWMIKDLKVLVLDCPTRGVDVGVKSYIYNLMKEAKKEGLAMILITDELPEAIGMADNIAVIRNGKLVRIINRSEGFSEESIIEVMI